MTSAPKQRRRLFQRCYFVYILANLGGMLYTGLTDDLKRRIMEHKDGTFDGFTKKYRINRLMYFEAHTDLRVAANRELQVKKWRREKKIALFAESNPQWKDLTPEIFDAIGIRPLRSLSPKPLTPNSVDAYSSKRISRYEP